MHIYTLAPPPDAHVTCQVVSWASGGRAKNSPSHVHNMGISHKSIPGWQDNKPTKIWECKCDLFSLCFTWKQMILFWTMPPDNGFILYDIYSSHLGSYLCVIFNYLVKPVKSSVLMKPMFKTVLPYSMVTWGTLDSNHEIRTWIALRISFVTWLRGLQLLSRFRSSEVKEIASCCCPATSWTEKWQHADQNLLLHYWKSFC